VRIITYDELKDPTQFAILADSAFNWTATPERVAERRKLDSRYRDPFGFGTLDGRTLAGFVGVMDIKVRTRFGKVISAGGIHNVMTRPDYVRKGIAARLFARTHEHFRSKGYAFSFLFTSRSLVAWRLYDRLGYVEMPLSGRQAPAAYRVRPVKGRPAKPEHRGRLDRDKVERLFDEYRRRKKSTFTNDPGWLRGRMKWWRVSARSLIVDRDGFAYVETDRDTTSIYELAARSHSAYRRLLTRIEALNRPAIVHYLVRDPTLLKLYRSAGFTFRPRAFFVLMAKPLGRLSLRSTFGPDFSWSPLDQF
jgi:GNAT superfamily N-acetyltransferase